MGICDFPYTVCNLERVVQTVALFIATGLQKKILLWEEKSVSEKELSP